MADVVSRMAYAAKISSVVVVTNIASLVACPYWASGLERCLESVA
jgi:hypothetical protein